MANRIDASTMMGAGSTLTMGGSTFAVGYQGGALKSPSAVTGNGISFNGSTLTIKSPGAVIDSVDLRNVNVEVQANNVTIKNSLFNAASWHTIYQTNSASGLVVEYNTFDGQKANNSNADIIFSDNASITIRNNEFFNLPTDALNINGGLVEKNFFSGAGYQYGAHADAISIHGTEGPVTIRQNYIDYITPSDARIAVTNAVIKIAPVFGPVNDVSIYDNVLIGGGYTVYAYNATYSASNISITNNDIGLGKWGDLYPGSKPSNFSYSNQSFTGSYDQPSAGSGGGQLPASPPPPPPAAAPAAPSGGSSAPVGGAPNILVRSVQDFLNGGGGNDVIHGGGGIDVIRASSGNDVLFGGADRDWMTGEWGDDVYVYTSISDSRPGEDCDVLWGWGNGNDTIDLSGIDANTLVGDSQAFRWIGGSGFTGNAGDLRAYFDGSNTIIQADVNGDRGADFQIQVMGSVSFSNADFVL
jgi:Ca2+-binding RTX toxin-like protein